MLIRTQTEVLNNMDIKKPGIKFKKGLLALTTQN